MTPYYEDSTVTLHHGDCLDVLRSLPDTSVDAVVTDPPYGLEFMGKEWDGADGFRRSLNPNDVGRDNAFGRTSRTSPEYRTSGAAAGMSKPGIGERENGWPSHLGGLNPKCRNCDRWQRGANPCACESPDFPNERLPRLHSFQEWCEAWSRECLRVLKPGGHMLAFGGTRTWHRLACAVEDSGFEVRDSLAWLYGSGFPKSLNLVDGDGERTGWGTALKPAFEPIVVARKPLAGTVAANVLAHGTGALNIDGCRVDSGADYHDLSVTQGGRKINGGNYGGDGGEARRETFTPAAGRWPANVILDESQAAALDQMSGESTSPPVGSVARTKGGQTIGTFAHVGREPSPNGHGDSGGASRFFYVAKADTSERVRVDGIAHPTVKPLALMRWLVRLVTPPGGTVLEPFAGSGTTVEACILEGFQCIAIEREADYLPLIRQRIARRRDPVEAVKNAGEDGGLFDLLGEVTA